MSQDPKIGKDVIESLTIGMYEDCRFIYREYIQNSADQIDKAISMGILNPGEDEIHIKIDSENRKITIEDNATGIPKDKVLPILRNIAHSTKKRGEDKGFRGIGRLGGLGYCSRLTFETTFKGENVKSIMTWDASKLKSIINDRANSEEAVDVLEKVTSIHTVPEESDTHFFTVILEGVTSDDLLDFDKVKNYLSMVAPVDISTQFIYRNQIKDFIAKNNLKVDIYNIYINGEQIYKPYTNNIYDESKGQKKKVDDILDVEFFIDKDASGNILYWGWYSLSRLKGQMRQLNLARGIRLRKENIQIGDEEICKKFFANTSDQRFSFYFFGEIHAVCKDLIPNSRRDYFGENDTVKEFERKIRHAFSTLKDMCYDASVLKKCQRTIEERNELQEKIKQKEIEGYSSNSERSELKNQLDELNRKSINAQKQIAQKKQKLEDTQSPLISIIPQLTLEDSTAISSEPPQYPEYGPGQSSKAKTKFITDKPAYSQYSKNEKKLIGRIYASIAKAISDEKFRDAVIKIVEEDLTK